MAATENKPKFSMVIASPKYQELIRNTLTDPERAKRFVSAITSAVAVTPALQECETNSVLAGALLGESLNLSPSPQMGQFYLLPFDTTVKGADGKAMKDENGKYIKTKKAQFVLGYKGYIQLALRTGYYKHLNVIEVKDKEFISYNPFTEELKCEWITDEEERESLETVGYAAYFEYLNGFTKLIYWSKAKMLEHADKYSPAFSKTEYQKYINGQIPDNEKWKYSSHWYSNFDAMAKKTMLRQLISKWGIMSVELQTAYEKDNTFIEVDKSGEFIEDKKADITATIEAAEKVKTPEKIDLNSI